MQTRLSERDSTDDFWKCINNSGGWLIPRYLAKKSTIGGGQYAVMHRREIMPDCVLGLIRTLYPNPNGIPYKGHGSKIIKLYIN